MALERLGFELNEDGARVLFQTCSRGRLGLMFGEFCAWCFPFSSFFASPFFRFLFPHHLCPASLCSLALQVCQFAIRIHCSIQVGPSQTSHQPQIRARAPAATVPRSPSPETTQLFSRRWALEWRGRGARAQEVER